MKKILKYVELSLPFLVLVVHVQNHFFPDINFTLTVSSSEQAPPRARPQSEMDHIE